VTNDECTVLFVSSHAHTYIINHYTPTMSCIHPYTRAAACVFIEWYVSPLGHVEIGNNNNYNVSQDNLASIYEEVKTYGKFTSNTYVSSIKL